MLPRVDCEAIRRAEERACHSIVRLEVQFNVVVVDMRDKDCAMALCSSSLMSLLWAACTLSSCLAFCQRAGGRQLAVMFNGLGGDQWSTLPHAWLE